jgi:hypothetical protein
MMNTKIATINSVFPNRFQKNKYEQIKNYLHFVSKNGLAELYLQNCKSETKL